MTENNYSYAAHNGSPLLSREEQHRYASNVLSEKDFSTSYPTGYAIDAIANSLKWTLTNEKKRNIKFLY